MPQTTPSFDEIYSILKETALAHKKYQQETALAHKKYEQENALARKKHEQENALARKKHDQDILEIRAIQKETDRRMQETDRMIKELAKEDKKLRHLFSNKWGELVESLVSGCLLRILQERGIEVTGIFPNYQATYSIKGKRCEVDIIARNGHELVATEVKSTLGAHAVDRFLETLKQFTVFFPEYKDRKIYGAIAYLKLYQNADLYATKKGLFVIKATGDSACITNKANFKPKDFSTID